jgi:WD40 repeat protein
VVAIAFSQITDHVITAGEDGVIEEWGMADLKPVRSVGTPGQGVRSLAGGMHLVSAGPGAGVGFWSIMTGGNERWPIPAEIRALAKHESEFYLLTGDAGGVVQLWDSHARTEIVRFDGCANGEARPVTAVAFMPGRRRAVSGASDGSITVWDLPWLDRQIGAYSGPPLSPDPYAD